MKLKDRVCVITGGGRGIGESACRLFAAEGGRVVILDVNEQDGERTRELVAQDGGEALFLACDVASAESVQAAFDRVRERFGRVDVLYNNASVFWGDRDGPVGELSIDTWHRILSINLHGMFYCLKQAVLMMLAGGGGTIVNTSSSAGVIGIPGCDAYTASKGAAVTLTRSMAVEYGHSGIRVNCIAPAAIKTPMLKESDPDLDLEAFYRKTPAGRLGRPEEIARVALFLACDDSSYINGAIVVADGGITIT